MTRRWFRARLALAAALALTVTPAARAAQPPLIPRDVLLGNPSKTQPRISPDGTRIAYLAPSDKGVLNVWVRTIGANDDKMSAAPKTPNPTGWASVKVRKRT